MDSDEEIIEPEEEEEEIIKPKKQSKIVISSNKKKSVIVISNSKKKIPASETEIIEDKIQTNSNNKIEDKIQISFIIPVLPVIPPHLNIYEIASRFIPLGWENEFEFRKKELKAISDLVLKSEENFQIAPPNKDIFRAFYHTPKQNVRVIIVGQDPYPTDGVANGLSFSVSDGCNVPRSLANIYKEINNCYPNFKIPSTGNLEPWAKQGVFLINTCLTVPVGNANGHGKFNLWLPFISHVLESVTKSNKDIFVLLWGKNALSVTPYIKSRKDRILTASHPSPFSADKGFFGCGHFKTVNDNITEPKINWQL